ncbi:cytochrome c [Hymenobacter sp. HSC-4F20]|uniref:c-type cytochrome n=1 Tax=Hymenobacter sp. HSC-4F20 TaxID=2864135 RepID=UPI001C7344E7|nr:cytochrome c [Hymenobacter sp. HSC-4F20]MBX0291426.1 cytochrome c [Hymenobacter sp. HSC-4F20]
MTAFSFVLRLHGLVLLAFLLFYACKAGLLLTGRLDTLRAVRARTRIVDSGLGLLILVSGGVLLAWYPGTVPGWLWLKLALVLVLLPLAIAAMRRQFKPGVVLTFLGFLYVYGLSETGSPTLQRASARATGYAVPPGVAEAVATPEAVAPVDTTVAARKLSATDSATLAAAAVPAADAQAPAPLLAGQALFSQRCAACHGPDGKLGRNGAHDLTKSNLNTAGRVYMVTNGLGKMPGFKDQLTEEQIRQVAEYSLTLR